MFFPCKQWLHIAYIDLFSKFYFFKNSDLHLYPLLGNVQISYDDFLSNLDPSPHMTFSTNPLLPHTP